MLKLIKLIFLSCLLLVNVAFAQPKNIQLEYEVTRNGKSFGTVKESYIQEGGKYRILSTTKGTGLYALLGERVLTSHGEVTAKGLVPAEFKLKRGNSARKSLSASFDWVSNMLNMLVKGETRTAKLVFGTQDLASYAYQFMFTPPKGSQVKVALTTGKKLKQYTYNVEARDVVLKLGDTTYKTLHLVNAEVKGKKKKELWLSEANHYIPVKYLIVDKHGDKIEQNLTKISIK
ncbi:MAG: hypothetical protein COB34_00090 [Methylophilaceae bacterium]|nr:MAG: hypothetical protein COB34_00090 [Methylophilaceae bacterium]